MAHGLRSNNFKGFNKRKLAAAAIFVVIILIIIVIIIAVIAIAVISALLGQTDSGSGQPASGLVSTLWNAAQDYVQALWKQVLANPLQFLTGGGN